MCRPSLPPPPPPDATDSWAAASSSAAATRTSTATTTSWAASSSSTSRAFEPRQLPRPTPPPLHLTGGHRRPGEIGKGVRGPLSVNMSGVSGDAAGVIGDAVGVKGDAVGASASAAAAASGGGEVKPGEGKNRELRSTLPSVTLDADAVQKFAEIELQWGGDDKSAKPTILIRGLESATFHKDAARPTMQLLREAGEHPIMTGGGRIKHSTQRRTIFVYGYSIEFGPADLPRVAELCQAAYPDYEVTYKNEGY